MVFDGSLNILFNIDSCSQESEILHGTIKTHLLTQPRSHEVSGLDYGVSERDLVHGVTLNAQLMRA